MSYLQGKFVWFEHQSADSKKARAFYEPLFGWRTDVMPMGPMSYPMIMNGADGIGGYGDAAAGAPAQWRAYLSVEDVDNRYQAALAAGAKSVEPPTDYGPAGRGAVLADPTGAVFALWKSAQGDRPDVPQAPVGAWCWTELWTTDDQRALAFYEGVIGYSHDTMDMGPQGTYYMLKAGGPPRAGLMRSPPEMKMPPMWLPYVAVDNCDATAASAAALGGTVVMPPSDIPNIGRFTIMLDPLGAAVAAIKLQPAPA